MKLVNPIHFFDSKGRSLLSYDQLESENARLTKENATLKRLLVSQQQALKNFGLEPPEKKPKN
jgi:cell shape-determining protein MreC